MQGYSKGLQKIKGLIKLFNHNKGLIILCRG